MIAERVADATNSVRQFILLLENLLDVSRITSGRLDLDPEHVDLSAIVATVAERFQGELGEGQVVQHLTTTTGWWDKIRLQQVVGNLLSNAVKYGQGKPIEISLGGDADMAYLTVTDHGIGIEPEMQKRLFQRFERGLPGRHGHRGGFGLGLWITKEIVEAMGGRISVDSRPGEGSTFRIALPRDLEKSRDGDPSHL